MRLLWTYLKEYKGLLFVALLLATINQVFSLLDPQVVRIAIDRYASRISELTPQQYLEGMLFVTAATIGVALVSRIAKNFQDYVLNVITQRLGAKLYANSVSHSFRLPYAAFEDQRSGELLQKLQQARNDSQQLILQVVNVLFLSLISIVVVLGYAFTVYWLIGTIYFLMIPTLGLAGFYISRGIEKAQKGIVKETQALAGSTTETLRNVELVKSLGLEEQEIQRLNLTNEKILQLELKKIRLVRSLGFIQGTILNAIRAGLTLLMFWLIYKRIITLGEFFSLLTYSFFIFAPLAELGNVAAKYYETKASMAKLEEILNTPVEPIPDGAINPENLSPIKFTDVGFQYATSDQATVSNISFELRPGKSVAFVGPSGAGKTTILKLLVGLYQPSHGQISFNGDSSTDLNWAAVRQRIGLVSQDTQLFAGTIAENLRFVRPEATDEQCLKVLHEAAADNILSRSAEGLQSKIGEGGLKLSGGEKQRLAIARALLREPEVLIFDEATSSLDSMTEEEITATIREINQLRPNLVTVLVAHRLSTVTHVNEIYVLEKGHIIENGAHDELVKTGGLYTSLWRQQIGERS